MTFDLFTPSIFDFVSQLLGFVGFLRIFNSVALISHLEISGFFLPLFFLDEDSIAEISFFFNSQTNSVQFLNFSAAKSEVVNLFNGGVYFQNDYTLDESACYFNFMTFDYSLEYEIFDLLSFFIVLVLIFFIHYSSNIMGPQDDIVQFLSLVGAALSSGDDFFSLFLGFELLTIVLVLFMALDQRRFNYNKTVIFYYLLSVVVSLVIFFFLFFIYFLLNSHNTGFLNFYTFIFSNTELILNSTFFITGLSASIKFFFLNLGLLFMFKFTLGPAAFWVTYLYPTFPVFILLVQMIFLKYNLFFLFFEFFDFLFFYSTAELIFITQMLSLILFISLIFGSFAYKINNLKLLLTITSFSQISYVCISYLSPSFILLSYSLNYLVVYLFSLFFVLLILLVCNIFFNIQYLHELAYLRHYDFTLFLSLIFLFCSLAGLPPFIGFFVKYFLLLKLLTTPYLFSYGVALSIVSFLTLYIYLSVIYSLIKNSFSSVILIQNSRTFIRPYKNSFIFFFSASLYVLCFFLISPFLTFFSSFTFFFYFFEKFHLINILDLLEYYFH